MADGTRQPAGITLRSASQICLIVAGLVLVAGYAGLVPAAIVSVVLVGVSAFLWWVGRDTGER